MSLLLRAMENCIMMVPTTAPDGRGGTKHVWKDGKPIKAAIVYDSSMQARRAAADGVKALYTITTEKDINLQFHDVFRRLKDGKIFRVTSDGDDNKTPSVACLNMCQVTAEEFNPVR